MIKHVIYGFFGLLAASVLALAIYLDKPATEVSREPPLLENNEESGEISTYIAGASDAVGGAELLVVIKVIDGDTIAIQKGGASETVRFIGIDAPETGECFTVEATQKLKDLIGGGKVSLELDASQGERDKYDRLLAYVFTEGGVNVVKALIEGGFAREYTYSRTYKYQTEFKNAQASAQAAGRGLWAPGACASAPAAAPAPTQTQTQTAPPPPPPAPEPEEEVVVEKEEEKPEEKENPPDTSGYTCSSNAYNCSDFSTHAEAQAVYEACGGVNNDVHKLDANKDGEACESLP